MELEIVHFSHSDLQQVLALDKITNSTDWSPGLFDAELTAPHRINLVAKSRGELIGFVMSTYVAGELTVLAIAVDPVLQRQGIARRLISELTTQAKKAGCNRMFLEVRSMNVGGQGFYRACGFEDIGIRKGYYPEPRPDDAVQMLLNIP